MLAAQSGARWPTPASLWLRSMAVCGTLTVAFCQFATAQQAPAAQSGATTPAASQQTAPDAVQNPTQLPTQPPTSTAATPAAAPLPGEVSEDELRHMLVGKQLFLRGGYMDNDLNFNESGNLIGHSPQGSFTLSEGQIERVRLTKHKVELEGTRYGLHFLGALAYEDTSTSFETLKITPKKKVQKITIDREQVLVRKTKKETSAKEKGPKSTPASASPTTPQQAPATASATASQTPPAATEPSDADQLKAQIAAAPAAERPADPASVTTTESPLHAANLLRGAIDRIFSVGIDDRLKASMPDCWKLYYQAVAEKADYSPKDPAVLRQNAVDKKAKLLSVFQPDSNEYAQADAVSGMALYHTVIDPDGKPGEIAVARPIGFGLDENAVASIRKASFEPALKDGKPVPVLLDLVVEFHIYSKRTAAVGNPQDAGKPAEPSLPGPYSLQHP
jgi:TonB family protein